MLNRKTLLPVFLILLAFFLGTFFPKRPEGEAAPAAHATGGTPPSQERKILYWVDPMHPRFKSDAPGTAPDCGMDLVPVYEEANAAPPREGAVQIPIGKQQLMGVRFGTVARAPMKKTLRAVGRVAYDETRIARIHSKVDGWIEQVYVDFTGKRVQKNQPLLDIYSPALLSTQQEFLLAAKARKTLVDSAFPEIAAGARSLYESSRSRLLLWDIDEKTIDEIERTAEPRKAITFYSPVQGFVLARNAYPRQRITPETELYTVADLSTVWVLADVYEYEIAQIKTGQSAAIELSYLPGKTLRGTVDYVYPDVEPSTRTLKVRIQVPNPGYVLKPDMYANVTLQVDYGTQVAVPAEAVLDSGAEQIAFVALENGFFEPRKIRIGPEVDGHYVVLAGLEPGERVVTSAHFLVDSESRLKSALTGMAEMGHGAEHKK